MYRPSELDISYGWKGDWLVDARREAEQAHKRTRDVVIDGLEALGVEFLQPEVCINSIYIENSIASPAGSCEGVDAMRVYMRDVYFGDDAIDDELILTKAHELIHVARQQLVPYEYVSLERWATEGLAYFGEDHVSRNILGRAADIARNARSTDPDIVQAWLSQLTRYYAAGDKEGLVLPREKDGHMAALIVVESLYDSHLESWADMMKMQAKRIFPAA